MPEYALETSSGTSCFAKSANAFVAAILAISGTSILPAENMMLSEYSSKNNQGFIFGVKFLISFGAAPLGVFLITYTRALTGDFYFLLSDV